MICIVYIAYQYGVAQKRSGGMIWSWPTKYQYGIPAHTIPLSALHIADADDLECNK